MAGEIALLTQKALEASIDLKKALLEGGFPAQLETIAHSLAQAIHQGATVFFCGNGGSAADAQHLAAELLIRLRPHVNRPSIPAMALTMDPSTLTACGNDFSFEEIFSRPLSGLGKPGDVLVGITTSGHSLNVINAFKTAKEKGMLTLGFLGNTCPYPELCDYFFQVPSTVTARIQEIHILVGHLLMESVEDLLFPERELTKN